jgi:hypothetical protein
MKTPTEETDETRRLRVERILSVLRLENLGRRPTDEAVSTVESVMGGERSSPPPLPSETVVEVLDLPFTADRWGPLIARNVRFADGSVSVQVWNVEAREWQRPPGKWPSFSDAMISPPAQVRPMWEQGIPLSDWCAGQIEELPIRNERGEWTGGVDDFLNP